MLAAYITAQTAAITGLAQATADAAAFVGADYLDVVPVTNATSAVRTSLIHK